MELRAGRRWVVVPLMEACVWQGLERAVLHGVRSWSGESALGTLPKNSWLPKITGSPAAAHSDRGHWGPQHRWMHPAGSDSPWASWAMLVARLSPWRKLGDAIIGTSTPARCPVYPLRTPAAKHPGTAHLLAGFYWEQRGDMQGLHCPRAGSSRPGTRRLWSTAAESCAFPTVCARACGCSPSVPVPACGSSSPARGQSCGVAPTEVTGAGVSMGGPLVPQHLL